MACGLPGGLPYRDTVAQDHADFGNRRIDAGGRDDDARGQATPGDGWIGRRFRRGLRREGAGQCDARGVGRATRVCGGADPGERARGSNRLEDRGPMHERDLLLNHRQPEDAVVADDYRPRLARRIVGKHGARVAGHRIVLL